MASRSEGQDRDRHRSHDGSRSRNRRLSPEFDQGPSYQERCVVLPHRFNPKAYCSSCDPDVAADVIAIVFRTYIAEHSIDHLASNLKKGGIKDLLLFFPLNKREDKVLDEFFRKQGLAQVADWWTKKKYAILKEEVVRTIKEHLEHGDSNSDVGRNYLESVFFGIDHEFCFSYQMVSAIQTKQEEQPLPESELVQCIWTGLISSVEWSARPDQHEGLIIKEVAVRKSPPPPLTASSTALESNAARRVSFLEIRGNS